MEKAVTSSKIILCIGNFHTIIVWTEKERKLFMRVIAGKARRLLLKTIDGLDTRPTTDRIKETLFNILQTQVPGSRFLDLFAGSGGIGIEALSRGARAAVFVEQNQKAADCIRENLRNTRLEEDAAVMVCDAVTALRRMEGKQEPFDLVFMDPPYNQGLELAVLEYLRHSALIGPDTQIIVEASLETETAEMEDLGYTVDRVKTYKTNQHIFLAKGDGHS